MRNFLGIHLLLLLNACSSPESEFKGYEGRYALTEVDVGIVQVVGDELTYRPLLWRSTQRLSEVGPDSFSVRGRPDRTMIFHRNDAGTVVAAMIQNMGTTGPYRRLAPDEYTAAELAFSGEGAAAVDRLQAADVSENNAVRFTENLLYSWPSRSEAAISFIASLSNHFPENASVQAMYGEALVRNGFRDAAQERFEAAQSIDSENELAITGLGRLGLLETNDSGWSVPFSLDTLFASPTADEIEAVLAEWRTRELQPSNVEIVYSTRVDFSGDVFDLHVLQHEVHGERHYGAIISPSDGGAECCAVIVQARGVSWNYGPMTIGGGLRASDILRDRRADVIYVVPSFRGETLIVDDREFRSAGDPTDSWDGATDDAIALLNVALSQYPAADPERICALGGSRGGSVVLLMGIRDSRIKCVVAIAAPTDWFIHMSEKGWTMAEVTRQALRIRATPDMSGGQFIRRYLRRTIEGETNVRAIRLKMVAASPMYFADRLPLTQAHYGVEDEIVPIANGRALVGNRVEVLFHANMGHDVNTANAAARLFLLAELFER